MNFVFFDFDKTITIKDTIRPFAFYLSKRFYCKNKLFIFYFFLFLYKLKLFNDKFLKELFLSLFIKGFDHNSVAFLVSDFFNSNLNKLTNETILERLNYHINNKDNVYILSSNFDFFLEPLKTIWSINGIISTETEKQSNQFTGRIIGNTCKGKNKLKRIESLFGKDSIKNILVYSDNDDALLLRKVGHGINICTLKN